MHGIHHSCRMHHLDYCQLVKQHLFSSLPAPSKETSVGNDDTDSFVIIWWSEVRICFQISLYENAILQPQEQRGSDGMMLCIFSLRHVFLGRRFFLTPKDYLFFFSACNSVTEKVLSKTFQESLHLFARFCSAIQEWCVIKISVVRRNACPKIK